MGDLRQQVSEPLARQRFALRERGRLHDGLARRVVDGNAKVEIAAVSSHRLGILNRADQRCRQSITTTDDVQSNAVRHTPL